MIEGRQIERPKKVLVVDDQEINRDALEVILGEDYEFLFAANGIEAVAEMEKNATELSIVLLDLIMPKMTGFEVLRAMHGDPRLMNIPTIVLTSEKDAELEALQLGAMDFITKPFDMPEIIQARVSRIIELSEGRQLISAAEHDLLTGLYSRNFFLEYANRLYKYHPELELDAIVLNIEQFHSINAVNGREFGDVVLKSIGREIQQFLQDTFGIASRFEADSFHIYLRKQPDYLALLWHFQNKVDEITPNVRIHLRMGVMAAKAGVEPVLLFDRARTASNMVRGNYQNPLMIYDEEMLETELFSQRLVNDLNRAVAQREFMVVYQPKYDIQCDPPRLASAEALIRWNHSELGMVTPNNFVPLFEGNGLIRIVDSYVWSEAAKQIVQWKKDYGLTIPVSVNLSRTDIFDPTLIERLVRLVEDNGLAFSDLKLEITESAYTDKAKDLLLVVRQLRSLGFDIEMDDFGTGYSSLNMLSEMPIDVLKMDMKFVKNIEMNETDMQLVKLILDIAAYLKLKVVAEGVETPGQLRLLKNAGCQMVQGYYFSKPVPPDDFEKLLIKELSIERS